MGFPIFPDTFKNKVSGRISAIAQFRDPYTENFCADWDPEAHGLLASTEERTREIYDGLGVSRTGVGPDPEKQSFYYTNIAAVDERGVVRPVVVE